MNVDLLPELADSFRNILLTKKKTTLKHETM